MADGFQLPGWIQQHIELYLSDPERGHLWDASIGGGKGPTPTLLLTTTGAKSGQPRLLPLIYGAHGDGAIIIASKGGAPEHPAWYLNLVANPAVEVQIAARKFAATARVASGEERERLWAQMVEVYPPYTDYQNATAREIPVVVLDPA